MRLMSMLGAGAGRAPGAPSASRRRAGAAPGAGRAPATGEALASWQVRRRRRIGREHAVDQGAGDEQADQQRGDAHDRGFDDLEPVGAVQAQQRLGRRGGVAGFDAGEFHVGDLHLVAARLRRSPSPISPGR